MKNEINTHNYSAVDAVRILWQLDYNFPVPFIVSSTREVKKLLDCSCCKLVNVKSFVFVYENYRKVPTERDLLAPLPDDIFFEENDFDEEELFEYLNKDAHLIMIFKLGQR
jgi:hypothetical protein